ncbi:MAG: aldehyde dehydrogenase family protein [Ignavibacteriaceae bacterium]|nr:aldehyde dehydrogenase family protein [Ignavibacteriaceae bacterium]
MIEPAELKPAVTISYNPANGEKIGETPVDTLDDLKDAINLARKAQKTWAAKSYSERKKYLLKIRDYIVENADNLSEIISLDSGKTLVDALSTEVLPVTMAINYYAKNAGKLLKRHYIKPGNILLINKRAYVDRVPYGVIGIISPWNYPFAIPFHEIAMALITGNTVILKAASQTQEVSKAITRCVRAANLPEGVFTNLNLPGKLAGNGFVDLGVDKIFFTGSVEVGKQLMAKCAENLTPLSLELGGKDAMIVLEDADLDRAVAGALWAGFSNTGQSCAGVERIFVQSSIYEKFSEKLKFEIKKLKFGSNKKFSSDIGTLTTESQLLKVREHVNDAIEKGASIFSANDNVGEKNGYSHAPVLVENVNNDMLIQFEETFGPVLTLKKFEKVEEAIAEANNSNLGLTASIWTKNHSEGKNIASKIQAGTVTINDHLMSHGLAETPWGGFKQSGPGRTHGYIGLEEMTQPQCIVNDILPGVKKNMWWYPHNQDVFNGLKDAMKFLYGKNLGEKAGAIPGLLKVFLRTFRKDN